jgi:hypothetical protein
MRYLSTAALLVMLAAGGAMAQTTPRSASPRTDEAAPLPRPGQAPSGTGVTVTLKPTEKVVTAFLTSIAAIETCGFGDKQRIAGVGEAYGLRPDKLDQSFVNPTFERLHAEIKENKNAFCERALRMYGEQGTDFNGLLTR